MRFFVDEERTTRGIRRPFFPMEITKDLSDDMAELLRPKIPELAKELGKEVGGEIVEMDIVLLIKDWSED